MNSPLFLEVKFKNLLIYLCLRNNFCQGQRFPDMSNFLDYLRVYQKFIGTQVYVHNVQSGLACPLSYRFNHNITIPLLQLRESLKDLPSRQL